MRLILYFTILIITICIIGSCSTPRVAQQSEKKNTEAMRIAFYNVENLFDTLDNPLRCFDDEFSPLSDKKWNTNRYQAKLASLSKVITEINPKILGLCEVENRNVIKDLRDRSSMTSYKIIHYNSPDLRGIDNAILVDTSDIQVVDHGYIRIDFPDHVEADYTSRDIVYMQAKMKGGSTIHYFVNHWPSRYGGTEASEPKRLWVAQHLKNHTDKILTAFPNHHIVVMGDFNDEPNNKSVEAVLGAKMIDEDSNSLLVNTSKATESMKGTYNFRGNWNMLDQVIVSKNCLENSEFSWKSTHSFEREWLMFQHERYGSSPSRTYGGPNYYGGISDHLAIYADFEIKY